MYLLSSLIGLLIGAFVYGTSVAMAIGFGIGLVVAVVIHLLMMISSDRGSSSVFDSCILFILLEGIFIGLSA